MTEAVTRIMVLLSSPGDILPDRIEAIQGELPGIGYTANERFGADGVMGNATSQDLLGFIRDNPEVLVTMNPSMVETLVNRGHARELSEILNDNPEVRDNVMQELSNATNAGQLGLSDMSEPLLRQVQGQLSLLGLYPAHFKVDALIGNGTRGGYAAFAENAPAPIADVTDDLVPIPIAVEAPADPVDQNTPIIDPVEPAVSPTDHFADASSDNYGVPQELIDRAWDAVDSRSGTSVVQASVSDRPLVVLDLGHNVAVGSRRGEGAVSPFSNVSEDGQLSEVDVVDPVAQALAARLYAAGYDVAFTREPGELFRDGEAERLSSRGQFATQLSVQGGYSQTYLISLHVNGVAGAGAERVHGADVFAAGSGPSNGIVDFGGPEMDPGSVALAESIADNYRIRPDVETDVYTADMTVLTSFDSRGDAVGSTMHAALIELGYMTSPDDTPDLEEIMRNPARAADQIFEGIHKHHQSVADPTMVAAVPSGPGLGS